VHHTIGRATSILGRSYRFDDGIVEYREVLTVQFPGIGIRVEWSAQYRQGLDHEHVRAALRAARHEKIVDFRLVLGTIASPKRTAKIEA
jgi:hypothetical protein